jgi:hypothetical protein
MCCYRERRPLRLGRIGMEILDAEIDALRAAVVKALLSYAHVDKRDER